MQDMVMDILRAVASPSVDIRRKTLDIVLDLINSRNIRGGYCLEEGNYQIAK